MSEKPIKTIRVGGVSFSIWAVPKENYTDISIKFEGKSYKDKQTGEWKTTYNFFKNDLIKLYVAVQEVIRWAYIDNIFKKEEDKKEEGKPPDFKTAEEYASDEY